MAHSTSFIGKIILSVTSSAFLYYVLFCFLPFYRLEEDNLFYSFFPSLIYAFIIPAIFGIVFIGSLLIYTLYQYRDDLLSFARKKNDHSTVVIRRIRSRFIGAMEQWLVIGVSGVTCSGKTTLASSLYQHFRTMMGTEIKVGIELNRVEIINQDVYFREVDDPNHQKIEVLKHLNWEIIEALDMDRMTKDVMEVLGKNFRLYNTRSSALLSSNHNENLFHNHYTGIHPNLNTRPYLRNGELTLDNDHPCTCKIVRHNNLLNILIIEGFLIFNHPVTFDLCNVKYHLHIPYEVCEKRRRSRVYDPPDVPCYFDAVVWPAYEKHLKEFKDREDVMFLNGDVPEDKSFQFVLKSILDEL